MNNQKLLYRYCNSDFLPGVKYLVSNKKVDIDNDDEPFAFAFRNVFGTFKVYNYLKEFREKTLGRAITLNDIFKFVYAKKLIESGILSENQKLLSLINRDNIIKKNLDVGKIKTKRK